MFYAAILICSMNNPDRCIRYSDTLNTYSSIQTCAMSIEKVENTLNDPITILYLQGLIMDKNYTFEQICSLTENGNLSDI